MKLRNIDFDPPPPPPKKQYYDNYDIREYNYSISTIDSDRAFINVSNNSSSSTSQEDALSLVGEESSQEKDNQCRHQQQQQQCELDVSLTWSNAPGFDDSFQSNKNSTESESKGLQFDNDSSSESDGNKKEEKQNNNDTDTTVYNYDDESDADENKSAFLSWPELPELPVSSLPQHEQIQQRCSESVTNDRPPSWFHWGRRASDSDEILNAFSPSENGDASNSENNNNNKINNDIDTKKSNDDSLVPAHQQWWLFGRKRNTLPNTPNHVDSYAAARGRKSSAVESNVKNSGRWHTMESFVNGGDDIERRSSGEGSMDVNGDNDDVIDNRRSSVESNNSSAASPVDEETRPKPIRMLSRRKSIESNNSSYSSAIDGETRPKPIRMLSRRQSIESNKSFTSSVDHELNQFLFPRRGHRASIRSLRGTESSVASSCNPPQSQDEDGVEVIVDKLKKSFVDLSPIDRMLLSDMASSKNTNRWRKPGISGSDGGNQHNSMVDLGGSTLSIQASENELGQVSRDEAKRSPQAAPNNLSQELNGSLGSTQEGVEGVPEIYWDSDKISKMRGEGVSLARAKLHDEVSSIASSDHSGHIKTRRNYSQKRLSFTSSFLWWNNATIDEEDVDDDCSFKPEKIVPFKTTEKIASRASSGKLTSMKSSIRPKSIAISTPPNLLSMAKRKASIDYDDYDDDEMYSKKNPLVKEDLKHETVVKEANEIMNSVNNSVIAMGMNAPFRNIDEVVAPFPKLHKNLGYQMDALNAAIVRTTKSSTNALQGTKKSKSKKLKASKMKSSQFSMSSDNSFMDSSNQSSTMNNILNDSEAMSKFILSQLALLQSQQSLDGSSITSTVTPRSFYTSWLPNYMWYQTIAADASSIMRPTSLCSGTGITGDEQYLNPEMLKVFEMFSTYFVGSKHLFQEANEDTDDEGAKMRRSYWMDTIEEIDSADESSEYSTSSDSEVSDESDMVYELGEVGSADIGQFVDAEKQIEILQTVINDLRKSQLNDRPILSIEASAPGQDSNLSILDESGRANKLSSSTSTNESNSLRESNLTSSAFST
eukprot:scaffold1464_cov149-Skeletonema_menzelii.AAC.18